MMEQRRRLPNAPVASEQEAYDLGHSNPSKPMHEWLLSAEHAVAYHSGQLDAQAGHQRNAEFRRDDYDELTNERRAVKRPKPRTR